MQNALISINHKGALARLRLPYICLYLKTACNSFQQTSIIVLMDHTGILVFWYKRPVNISCSFPSIGWICGLTWLFSWLWLDNMREHELFRSTQTMHSSRLWQRFDGHRKQVRKSRIEKITRNLSVFLVMCSIHVDRVSVYFLLFLLLLNASADTCLDMRLTTGFQFPSAVVSRASNRIHVATQRTLFCLCPVCLVCTQCIVYTYRAEQFHQQKQSHWLESLSVWLIHRHGFDYALKCFRCAGKWQLSQAVPRFLETSAHRHLLPPLPPMINMYDQGTCISPRTQQLPFYLSGIHLRCDDEVIAFIRIYRTHTLVTCESEPSNLLSRSKARAHGRQMFIRWRDP